MKLRKSAASALTEPIAISLSIAMGTSGNFLIVTTGPFNETGGNF